RISPLVEWSDLPPGQLLQQRGMRVQWVWVTAAGALEVVDASGNGAPVLPGDVWGEVEVLAGIASSFEVRTLTHATVVGIRTDLFHGLFRHAEFASAVAVRLARLVDSGPRLHYTAPWP